MEDDFTKQLLEYVNGATIALLDDAERYKDFLGFLSRMDSNHKISNKMLIYGYDPEATDVRTMEEWNKAGVTILHDAARIYVLGYDGSSEAKYFAREVFDIRNTDAAKKGEIIFQDSGEFAETVMASAPCKIRFNDDKTSAKEKCIYDDEKKVILVTNDFRDYDEIAQSLLREYAHFYLNDLYRKAFTDKLRSAQKNTNNDMQIADNKNHEEGGLKTANEYHYNREAHKAEALSAEYMVCSRYNRKLPEIPYIRRSVNISLAAIRTGLDNMCAAFSRITARTDMAYISLRQSYEQTMS